MKMPYRFSDWLRYRRLVSFVCNAPMYGVLEDLRVMGVQEEKIKEVKKNFNVLLDSVDRLL